MDRTIQWITRTKVLLCIAVVVAFSVPTAADDAVSWFTIDGGGGTASTGSGYTLTGTIGQPDATTGPALTGGGYAPTGGFWSLRSPACTTFSPADFNQDCSVDADDLALFNACLSGAAVVTAAGCTNADLDHDGDVDQSDFGIFQRCYRGKNQPVDLNCAN